MNDLLNSLRQGDLRSVGQNNAIKDKFNSQEDFDKLLPFLFSAERGVVMRAADLIEKISLKHPEWLSKHKKEILGLCETASDKELKWHLAQLLPRLKLSAKDSEKTWKRLSVWLLNKNESKLVRVNALQALYDLSRKDADKRMVLDKYFSLLEKEKVPSLLARMRNLK